MFKKYEQWYKSLRPAKQLAVSFAINWLYWFIAWLIAELFIFEEQRSWLYGIFHATWMALFMTIPFSWKQLKALFKNREARKSTSANDNVKA